MTSDCDADASNKVFCGICDAITIVTFGSRVDRELGRKYEEEWEEERGRGGEVACVWMEELPCDAKRLRNDGTPVGTLGERESIGSGDFPSDSLFSVAAEDRGVGGRSDVPPDRKDVSLSFKDCLMEFPPPKKEVGVRWR